VRHKRHPEKHAYVDAKDNALYVNTDEGVVQFYLDSTGLHSQRPSLQQLSGLSHDGKLVELTTKHKNIEKRVVAITLVL